MIPRALLASLVAVRHGYPALYLGGPRQSGKTTLVRASFPDLPYVNLENLDTRRSASEDPRGFLGRFPAGAVLDEVQRVPELFNYLQEVLDAEEGFFAFTGSQNFLLMEQVGQSLAGRVATLTLHPLAYGELPDKREVSAAEAIFRGGYPRLVDRDLAPELFYESYLTTYVERDVRQLANVTDLGNFVRFVRLCAARTAQTLNFAGLAQDCSIAVNTARAWFSILETSYLVTKLEPYYRNFEKRISKTPRLYFNDTGLACHLLGIRSAAELQQHYLYGRITETYLVTERIKRYTNAARRPRLSFWRESGGHEVDLIEERGALHPRAWELKSSQTGNTRYFKELTWWRELTGASIADTAVVYLGEESLPYTAGKLVSWREWLGEEV